MPFSALGFLIYSQATFALLGSCVSCPGYSYWKLAVLVLAKLLKLLGKGTGAFCCSWLGKLVLPNVRISRMQRCYLGAKYCVDTFPAVFFWRCIHGNYDLLNKTDLGLFTKRFKKGHVMVFCDALPVSVTRVKCHHTAGAVTPIFSSWMLKPVDVFQTWAMIWAASCSLLVSKLHQGEALLWAFEHCPNSGEPVTVLVFVCLISDCYAKQGGDIFKSFLLL